MVSPGGIEMLDHFDFMLDESILIVFIDYGNSETKPANEVYPLQESLARLPAMTVACTLAEVSSAFPQALLFIRSIVLVIST